MGARRLNRARWYWGTPRNPGGPRASLVAAGQVAGAMAVPWRGGMPSGAAACKGSAYGDLPVKLGESYSARAVTSGWLWSGWTQSIVWCFIRAKYSTSVSGRYGWCLAAVPLQVCSHMGGSVSRSVCWSYVTWYNDLSGGDFATWEPGEIVVRRGMSGTSIMIAGSATGKPSIATME